MFYNYFFYSIQWHSDMSIHCMQLVDEAIRNIIMVD